MAGLAVSGYLTVMHYTTAAALSCPDTGIVNCTKVTTSAQSMVLGVLPVALLGVGFFAVMAFLCRPAAWRSARRAVAGARIAGSVAGVAMVCYLVGVELLAVHAICLWCTAVHAVAVALFIAVLAAELHVAEERPLPDPAPRRLSATG